MLRETLSHHYYNYPTRPPIGTLFDVMLLGVCVATLYIGARWLLFYANSAQRVFAACMLGVLLIAAFAQ